MHFSSVLFVIVAAVFTGTMAGTLSDEQKAKLATHHKECAAKLGTPEELIKNAIKNPSENFPAESEVLKKHLACVAEKIGFLNDKGEIQNDVLKQKMKTVVKPELVDDLVAKCAIKKANVGQTTYDAVKCFHDNTSDHIRII